MFTIKMIRYEKSERFDEDSKYLCFNIAEKKHSFFFEDKERIERCLLKVYYTNDKAFLQRLADSWAKNEKILNNIKPHPEYYLKIESHDQNIQLLKY